MKCAPVFLKSCQVHTHQPARTPNKRAEQVLSVHEPIIESNFNESIKEAACKKYKLIPKLSSSEKQKEKIKVLLSALSFFIFEAFLNIGLCN
jgi:hypothetical protein